MNSGRANNRKGFTLIEVVVVMIILVLAAALGVVGVDGYLEHAEQEARDSVARTIFMAAQTALTHEYNQDRNYYTNNNNVPLPAPYDYLPGGASGAEAEKQGHQPPALVYMILTQGVNNASQPLYQMIAPYLNDKSILNDNILIEFNRETGMMLSAFYTDVGANTLGYGTAAYDVRQRGAEALTNGFVGFYGVNSTGEVVRTNPINTDGYEILLVDYIDPLGTNYGLLTAEITMPRDVDENYVFSLSLLPQTGSAETFTFAAPGGVAGVDFTLSDLGSVSTVADAIRSPRVINGCNIPVYYESFGATKKLVFILDGVQSFGSTENSIGIAKNYPNIKGGILTGTLEISDNTDSASIDSEDYGAAVHAFYGADSTSTLLTVKSVRHLNNVRYCQTAASFAQRANVYMHDYKGDTLNFTPISNRLDAWQTTGAQTDFGFYGTYTSSEQYAIFDLSIDLTGQTIPATPGGTGDMTLYNAGLFDTVRHGATVSGLRFASSQPVTGAVPRSLRIVNFDANGVLADAIAVVQGIDYAGGVAAVNEGTIRNCTMLGSVSASVAGYNGGAAGGIAGGNSNGSITRCASACAVSGNRYAGGIAGLSDGTISFSEAGTASWRDWNDATQLYTSGVPAYGAEESASRYEGGTYTSNNTFRVKIEQDLGAAGGIVGYMTGTGSKVLGCVNACKVEAGNEINGTGAHAGGMAGGIAGDLAVNANDYIAVGYCYNAGSAYATGSAGGLVGEVSRGKIAYCYNTGSVDRESSFNGTDPKLTNQTFRYTDVNTHESKTFTCYMPGETRNLNADSPNHAGGLIGFGGDDTVIDNCFSMQYAGDRFGGAFGVLSERASVTKCSFLRNILNNTSAYYYTDARAFSEADSPLKMYTVENLRKAPSDGNLDNSIFADGNFTSPAGVFGFKFPRLAYAEGGVSLPAHRTPWNPSIERFGRVSFTSGTLVRSSTNPIICTFYLAPPEGYIRLYSGNSSSNMETFIPLFDATGANSLTDARNAPNTWLEIYGYASYDEAYRAGSTQNYELQIRAVQLNPDSATDAIQIAAGFTHKYELRMYYDYVSGGHTPIPGSVTLLIAELFNKYSSMSVSVDHARLGDSDQIYLTDRSQAVGSCELEMTIQKQSNQNIRVFFEYADGKAQRIDIDNNMFNGSHPKNYEQALVNFTDCRVGFAMDTVNTPSNHDAWRFPCYMNDSGTVGIILWTNYGRYGLLGDGYRRTKPNMLGMSFPVTVTVEVYHGNTVDGTYTRTFQDWEG